MRKAVEPYGSFTWPIATYLPFLWSLDTHLFLKPTATRDFADGIHVQSFIWVVGEYRDRDLP